MFRPRYEPAHELVQIAVELSLEVVIRLRLGVIMSKHDTHLA